MNKAQIPQSSFIAVALVALIILVIIISFHAIYEDIESIDNGKTYIIENKEVYCKTFREGYCGVNLDQCSDGLKYLCLKDVRIKE